MTGIDEMFAEFAGNAIEDYQLDLFCWLLRERCSRRESHRDRQRFAQRLRPAAVRKAKNASRREYWREYRKKKRSADSALVAREKEASRLRTAAWRAARRAA